MNDELNPLGLIGIDHLQFTCKTLHGEIRNTFRTIGLKRTHLSQCEKQELFCSGEVRFLLTEAGSSQQPTDYLNKHGEGVCKMSFLVKDCQHALDTAISRGAELVSGLKQFKHANGVIKTAVIKGFGDVLNEFIERPKHTFFPSFTEVDDPEHTALKSPVLTIDHLTNNVPKGEMRKWVNFYQKIYGFKVTRYFDIKGAKTGLLSEVVQLYNGKIIIPINEPEVDNGKSQIQEFLERHNGAGVQHIALLSRNIIDTVEELQAREFKFLNIPHTYYEDISKRDLIIAEDIDVLEKRQLLVDGEKDKYLIQNFTDTYIGPLFFEFIQRKGHAGFGEGNFQALFNAIERDQEQRGYL